MGFDKNSGQPHQFSQFINMAKGATRLSAFTIVTGMLLLTGCSQESNTQAPAPKPAVTIYKVQEKPVGGLQDFIARTEAAQQADIIARVEGELIAKHFDEGGEVTKGQVLFEIDPATYQASLAQAKAELESKHSVAERAQKNLKRGMKVSQEGFISQSDLDKLVAEDLQAKAAVSSAQAALEKAELNLSYTKIVAPFSGRIGKIMHDIGNIVGPSTGALADLQATDPMYVNFQIDESQYISHLQTRGNPNNDDDLPYELSLRLPNNTLYDKPGELVFADTKIDSGMGTVEIRAQFANPLGIIVPGMYVTLLVESKSKQALALVPQSAVQSSQQGKSVLVVDNDNKVKQRLLTLGRRIDAMWVVEEGLSEGEQVIIEGLQKVRAGAEVTTVEKVVDPVTGVVSELDK